LYQVIIGRDSDPFLQPKRLQWRFNTTTKCPDEITIKSLSTLLKQQLPPPQLTPRVNRWNTLNPIPLITERSLCKALKSSQAINLSHKGRDILYRTLTLGLPTGNILKHFPNAGPQEHQCPNCLEPNEDPLHVFWHCTFAKKIWKKVFSIFRPAHRRKLETANFWTLITAKVFRDNDTNDFWRVVLSETLQALWWKRCRKKYSNTTLYPLFLLNHIIIKIQLALSNHMYSLNKSLKIQEVSKLIRLLTRRLNIAILRGNKFIIQRS
jgi:hypothetical protein